MILRGEEGWNWTELGNGGYVYSHTLRTLNCHIRILRTRILLSGHLMLLITNSNRQVTLNIQSLLNLEVLVSDNTLILGYYFLLSFYLVLDLP